MNLKSTPATTWGVSVEIKDVKYNMKLQIINVVWGVKYTNTFLELSLPTQFSAGNLRDLSIRPNYIIYTNEVGKDQIISSSIYQILESSCDVIFRITKLSPETCPFKILLKCHSDAIAEANKISSPIIFLSPDSVVSTGVFTYCENAVKRKIRLVSICSSRMSLQKYQKYSEEKKKKSSEGIVTWLPQELAVATVHNLHHRAKCLLMSDGKIGTHPSHMYWRIDENNLLAKAYHLHPLLFWPEKHDVYPVTSADGMNFLEKACKNFNKWEVIQNCNDLSLFEISSDDQFLEDTSVSRDFFSLKFWLKSSVSKAHRYFYKHDIILGDGIEKPDWGYKIQAIHQDIKHLHSSDPINLNFNHNFKKIRRKLLITVIFYKTLILQVFSGKKKLTFKKIFHHLFFLVRYRSLPYHTLPPSAYKKENFIK